MTKAKGLGGERRI